MVSFPVIAIVGPTAVGKTALSVALAKQIDGEIINGDAMQVYRELSIGTAKIREEEKQGIPHYLFDYKEPTESYSVAAYQTDVRACVEEIQQRQKYPIIVGGTGLYIQSVLFDYRFTQEATNPQIRARLEQELTQQGSTHLYNRLLAVDPESARQIHPNNHQRLIRALEIFEHTGKTKGQYDQGRGQKVLYDHLLIGLQLPRPLLYERINLRVDQMIATGLIEEAKRLWDRGIRNTQAVQAIGYQELFAYFEGQLSLEEAIDLIKKHTRRYAKRQFTYLRNKLDVTWFDARSTHDEIIEGIQKKLKDFTRNESNR